MVSEIFPTGPTYFQIQFENDSFHSYVAGQTIIGRVVVELKDKLKIMALKIELSGKGKIHWEKHFYADNSHVGSRTGILLGRRRRSYPAQEETYIYQKKYLFGERTELPITLQPGVHSFPYFFTLSPWLPSSFEGRHCHIRYALHATLERALFKDIKSDPLKFLIKGILDLNQCPNASLSMNVSEHKNWDFLCWKLWSVALNLSIDKTGFVPGESLKFLVKFNNSCSNVRLAPVKAYLIQKVIIIVSRSPPAKCTYEHKVLKIQGPIIEAGEVKSWQGQMEIPNVEPSGLGLYPSQVLRFDVQYYLKVVAKNVFSTISRKASLTIGTIPLRDAMTQTASTTNAEAIFLSFAGSQQTFTPFENLAQAFPAAVPYINISRSRSRLNIMNTTTSPGEMYNNANIGTNQEGNNVIPSPLPLSEQLETGQWIFSDNGNVPPKRSDTPPPSYDEAVKRAWT